jgi:pimeloyl-ACP methyl ester carboxylesterase
MTQHIPDYILQQARLLGRKLNGLAAVDPDRAGREAFRVFCTPRHQGLRDRDRGFLQSARQQSVELEDVTVATYRWEATRPGAPVALLLHGWESHSGRWYGLVSPLREAGFEVHALDAPAHGQSGGDMLNLILYSRVLKAYLEQIEHPYALIGHSLGGAAVVMSQAAFGAPPVEKAVVMGTFAETVRIVHEFGAILDLEPPAMDAVVREIERLSGLTMDDFSIVARARLLRGRVAGLVVHDRDDVVAPLEDGRAIAEAWAADLVETAGLGHSMQGREVADAVITFLRR